MLQPTIAAMTTWSAARTVDPLRTPSSAVIRASVPRASVQRKHEQWLEFLQLVKVHQIQ